MLHEANGQRDLSAGRQLQIFEEYNALLEEMMQNGEYTGTKLGLIAKKMQISDRQVRTAYAAGKRDACCRRAYSK